jgi:hypothetical protein
MRDGSARTIHTDLGILKADASAVELAHLAQPATHPISQIRQKCRTDIIR